MTRVYDIVEDCGNSHFSFTSKAESIEGVFRSVSKFNSHLLKPNTRYVLSVLDCSHFTVTMENIGSAFWNGKSFLCNEIKK